MMLRVPRAMFPRLLGNQRGVALLYLVIMFTLLGALVSFGARKLGALVTQGKINEAKAGMERDVQAIVSWAAKNSRLPNSSEYPGIFGTAPLDAWGKPVVFAYYSSPIRIPIFAQTSSAIKYNGQPVAFLLLSNGEDMRINSTINGNGPLIGDLNSVLKPDDLYRIVMMHELTAIAGHAGVESALGILNNELPNACKRKDYSATIFGKGGVPPYTSYAVSGLPVGLSASASTILGNSTTARGPYNVSVTMTDSAANVVKRSYVLNLMSSCSY